MAQVWQLGTQAVRPGTYFRVSSGDVTTVGAVNGIAAVLFQSNWGELNKVVEVDQSQLNNLTEMFGNGSGVNAIREALLGGATTVKAVRVGEKADGITGRAWIYSPKADVAITATVPVPTSQEVEMVTHGRFNEYHAGYTIGVKSNGKWLTVGTDYTIEETRPENSTTYTSFKVKLTATGMTKLNSENTIWVRKIFTANAYQAVRIYSRCAGARDFTYSVKTNLVTGKREFTVYDGTTVFDNVEFEAGGDEAQALVDVLATNKNFLGKKVASGVLADVTGKAITGGSNPKITVASYSKATELLERQYWNVILADRASLEVRAVLSAFIKQSYNMGHLGMYVTGGLTSETLDDRMAYSASLNDWRIVYLLSGWKDNTGTTYSDWRAAARIGGMIAACETNASLTHIVISDALELLEPLTNGEMVQAEQKGCLVLSLNDEGQIWIDNAINSLITLGNDQDEGWKKIRRTKCRHELMTRINRTCDRLIGRLNNDTNGRATLITAMQSIINEMCAEGKLFFGSYVTEDTRYKPAGDKAYFVLFVGDIDSIEKIYLDFNFSYANPFE